MHANIPHARRVAGSPPSGRSYVALGLYLRAALVGVVLIIWTLDLLIARTAGSATSVTLLLGGILVCVYAVGRLRALLRQPGEEHPESNTSPRPQRPAGEAQPAVRLARAG